MKTDLAQVFSQVSELKNGKYRPTAIDGTLFSNGYDDFISVVKSSSASKLFYRTNKPKELWTVPAIGLILADTLIINGWYDDNGLKEDPSQGGQVIAEMELLSEYERSRVEIPDLEPGYFALPAFAYFAPQQITDWLRDANPFIEEGRLIYLPQRIVIKVGRDASETKIHDYEMLSPWGIWHPVLNATQSGSALLLPNRLVEQLTYEHLHQVFDVAMPYLHGLSLTNLHRVMNDQEDALILFRNAISKVLSTYLSEASTLENPNDLVNVGLQIRRDVLDPELARLNQVFKRVTQVRAIKTAGAALGTIGLLAAAISTGGLLGVVSAALGAGASGVLSKEIAEYRSEVLSLHENPWYFAWGLKKRSHSR